MPKRVKKPSNREELAAFLRSRRSKLSPEQVGLPKGTRRRLTGLRREEVAQLSGVSVTWYTWLEQAKNIQVSIRFLERLSEALQLNDAERKHLFLLCQVPLPDQTTRTRIEVNEELRRMLESISGPAYMQTSHWDLVHWNAAASALWGDVFRIPPHHRNILRMILLDEPTRSIMIDWEPWARTMVARFRLDVAGVLGEPEVIELIEELKERSPEFRRWWAEPEVVGKDEQPRSYLHPIAGRLDFIPTTLAVDYFPGLRLRVFTARDAQTAEKMHKLVASLETELIY